MSLATAAAPVRRTPPANPTTPRCQGCGAPCGPDDVLHLSSGVVAICAGCWDRWRAGGYARTVRS